MERSEAGLNKCNEFEVKLDNPNILMISCEDGNIPESLLVELLVRLPVKSVFRFKLVSRMWLSIISDPCFVRAYVSRASLLSQQSWTIVRYHMRLKDSQFSLLDYELLKDLCVKPSFCVVGVPSIHQPRKEEEYWICAGSNGLVFYLKLTDLSNYADPNYFICNPLTGHYVALPPLAGGPQLNGWGFHTHVEDGFLKSYRVARFVPPIVANNRLKFQVYVSEIGEWKDFIVPSKLFPLYIQKPAAVLNGILHWIATGYGIIAYDPYQNPENMRVITFPGDSDGDDEFSCLCVEYEGKLRYFKVGEYLTMFGVALSFKVWVLNDYSCGDWYLQHYIRHVDVPYDANFPSRRSSITPMCFHPFDSDIVYLGCDDCCVSYNIVTRKLQVEDEFFRHSEKRRVWYAFSFLFMIPHWPISIRRPSHGATEG